MKKAQKAKPAPVRAGEPILTYESYHQVTMLILNGDVPDFCPGLLAATLLLELEKDRGAMDQATYMAILRVAACLQKQVFDEYNSDRLAREVIKKARCRW